MAYDTFIPKLWSASIMRNLERLCVFAEDCNREYEGEFKKAGDTVHILGAASPTIYTIDRSKANDEINDPEEPVGTDTTLTINQMSYFNYMVGDIDKAQAVESLMDSLTAETAEKMASTIDAYIAKFAADTSVSKLNATVPVVNASNVLTMLDSAIQKLYENDVKPTTELVVTVTPRFYTLFRNAYIDRSTDNAGILKNGKVGMYGNVTVKMSNNVYKTDSGATDNIMIRTKRAVAFVNPYVHNEAYRPEKRFADAIKGYSLYDAKVIRPKEILNINVKYA